MSDNRPEAAGRPALAASLSGDWERFLDLLDSLPRLNKRFGTEATINWARTVLSTAFDTVALAEPLTPTQLQRVHRLRLNFTEGALMPMLRSDYIGRRRRTKFAASCEAILLAPTLRTVFRASAAARTLPDEAYHPETDAEMEP